MRCRRNQIPGKHSLSLTMKNIYLCGADRIKCRGCKSLVDDEEQLRGAQNKSNAGKGQGKPVDEEPLCGPLCLVTFVLNWPHAINNCRFVECCQTRQIVNGYSLG